jgi:DNA polymerase-3 subunit beta
MNITVGSEDFLRILGRTQGVVDRRHSMAILTNLVIEAGAGEIAVIATDLEVSLRQTLAAKVTEPGNVALSARKLFEIVRESASTEVTVRSLDSHWVGVSYGRSNFRLMGIDASEHPGMPAGAGGEVAAAFELETEELAEIIEKTLFAVSHDDTRSNLAGVHLDAGSKKGSIRLVATDGHRLAVVDRKAKGNPPKQGVILPRKGLSEVLKVLPELAGTTVTVRIVGNEAIIEMPGLTLSMRLVEGTFPDYKQVVPKESPNVVHVDRDAFLQTVRRVSLLSSEKARGIRLGLSPARLEISANNPDLGEASEDLEVEYSGPDLEIGFNARYILDVLQVLPEGSRVELGLGDQLSPGVIKGADPGYSYVVMPMRI